MNSSSGLLPNSAIPLLKKNLLLAIAIASALFLSACASTPPAVPIPADESPEWTDTISDVSPAIVTIRVDAVRAFDTAGNFSSQATGFVVDAKRGLILTNRHVVQPGPVVAEAIFINKEEVALTPVYYDPVHDFGFYRFDPKDLQYLNVEAIELAPEHATIGREIRVIGNDAGEQLSILAGTLSRLDREAPNYGRGNYNDANTFYIQAASSTSGGSSGSPVIDIHGHAVALNAGARTDAASSFFLPLDRVKRALELIRQNKQITRGTLQTIFTHRPFDELQRLGLQVETEKAVREAFPDQTGMLVVEQVVPGGPADGPGDEGLQPGDILVRLNGKLITRFIPLEKVLDSSVGKTVTLDIERGGKPVQLTVPVQNLFAITPDTYLEISGAILHDVSYQMARHLNRPVEGVFVADAGYMLGVAGVPRGAVITGFAGKPVENLVQLRQLLKQQPDGVQVQLSFFSFDQPRRRQLALVTIDRQWFPARFCERVPDQKYWHCTPLQSTAPAVPSDEPATVEIADYPDPRVDKLAHSLVYINFDMPYAIDGVDNAHYYGTGLVVDAERGLVVTDRNTVPVALGDVSLTIAGSLEIPARVVYIHPLHNLVMLQYDPALLGETAIKSATLHPANLQAGDNVWLVGYQPDQNLTVRETRIVSRDAMQLPLSSTFQFRESNLEVVNVADAPDYVSGVLSDKQGRVVALWTSFAFQAGRGTTQTNRGIPIEHVKDMLDIVRSDGKQPLYSLEAELYRMPLSSARQLGLPAEWAEKLAALAPRERRVLAVERLVAGSPVEDVLRGGDLILAVDGQPVVEFRALELATQKPEVKLTIFREGAVMQVPVQTVTLDGRNTDRIIVWAGAVLQEPHRAIAAQRGIPRKGVFVAWFSYGSPANHYGLYPGRRIVAVDGQPTPDLDAFLAAVEDKQNREPVRLTTINWTGQVEVVTLKLDLHYFPTYELKRTLDGWVRQML